MRALQPSDPRQPVSGGMQPGLIIFVTNHIIIYMSISRNKQTYKLQRYAILQQIGESENMNGNIGHLSRDRVSEVQSCRDRVQP